MPAEVAEETLRIRGLSSSHKGALSEFAAIVELMRRGHKIAVPLVDDDGVDLIVDYHVKVQVKSSAAPLRKGESWQFGFTRGRYLADGSRIYEQHRLGADVLICHAVPIDAWWIIPIERLREFGFGVEMKHAISLSANPLINSRYAALATECRDAWDVFEK
jgi:hypothetical protein